MTKNVFLVLIRAESRDSLKPILTIHGKPLIVGYGADSHTF